ncbi:DUF6309 family protein [Streptomyces sp. DB-54]
MCGGGGLCHPGATIGHRDIVPKAARDGEGGDRELVPPTGMTVAEAAAALRSQQDAYARSNPVCWRKLLRQRTAPRTPLFLSARAVSGVDYEGLRVKEGVTHLDGLHRMIAWAAWHRLPEGEETPAYVAFAAPR